MKNAVLISGKPNALLECAPSIIRNFIEPNQADVFIFYWEGPHSKEPVRSDIHYSKTIIQKNTDELIKIIYKPKAIRKFHQIDFHTDQYDSIYQPGDKRFIFNIQSMISAWNSVNNLKNSSGEAYDMVGRIRFDCYLDQPIFFQDYRMKFLNENGVEIPKLYCYNDCRHENGCVNDHIALATNEVMNIYCSLWKEIPRLYAEGCPFSAETLLGRWLKENKVEIGDLSCRHFIWRQMEHLISKNLNVIKEF